MNISDLKSLLNVKLWMDMKSVNKYLITFPANSVSALFSLVLPKCLFHEMIPFIADMSNSIETAIAIAFFGTIAIGIAIAKAIFQLLLLLLLLLSKAIFQLLLLILLREFSNYVLLLLLVSQNYCS